MDRRFFERVVTFLRGKANKQRGFLRNRLNEGKNKTRDWRKIT